MNVSKIFSWSWCSISWKIIWTYNVEVDIQYPEKLYELCDDFPFLLERMKIEKVEKLLTNLHDKTEHIIHMRNLEQAWNHGLISKTNLIKKLS